MMNVLDMIGGPNSAAVKQLAAQFGLPPEQAQAAMNALLPMVTAGVQREAQTKGTDGLAAAFANGQHEKYLTKPEALAQPETTIEGNAILGHLFGSKDVSRQVATSASQKTGIDPALLKKMLPVVATLVMAALARRSKTADAGQGGATPGGGAQGGGAGGLGGILGSLLDKDRDGSVLDDLGGMIGGSMNRKG